MGKKLLLVSIIIVAALFGVIFWKVNDTGQIHSADAVIADKVTSPEKQQSAPDKVVPETAVAASQPQEQEHTTEQKKASAKEDTEVVVEQIAPAAFGFLPQGGVLQVVGLLSEYDKSGPLMRYIHQLCQKSNCNVDVAYQAEIIDAKWQDDIVGILKLFGSESVMGGSLFIEADTVKLEGEATSVKSALTLQRYLNNLKEMGMDIQSHIEIEELIAQSHRAEQKDKKQPASVPVVEQVSPPEPVVKKVVETNTTQTVTKTQKRDTKLAPQTENNKTVTTDVQESSLPLAQTADTKAKSPTPPPPPVKEKQVKSLQVQEKQNSPVSQQKKVVSESTAKADKKTPAPKAKTAKKSKSEVSLKKRVQKRHASSKKPVEDIIAPSYMEISTELNRKVTTHSDMQTDTFPSKTKRSGAVEDIVAEPRLEILH